MGGRGWGGRAWNLILPFYSAGAVGGRFEQGSTVGPGCMRSHCGAAEGPGRGLNGFRCKGQVQHLEFKGHFIHRTDYNDRSISQDAKPLK